MPPRLIINADDFGLTSGINRAVLELYQAGALTSATLMANGPAFEEAAEITRANPGIGVGCHLVFIDGVPVSHPNDIPSLLGADGKTFRASLLDFIQAVLRGTVKLEEIALEAQAQIQKLQRSGVDVTHIDTHKHTHCFPAIASPVLHIAQRCGINAARFPFEPAWSVAASHASLVRRVQLAALNRLRTAFSGMTELEDTTLHLPDGTIGMAATGALNELTLRHFLTHLPSTGLFELCCHPGYYDAELEAQSTQLTYSRAVEYQALLSAVPEILSIKNAPELIHFGDLGVPGLQRALGQFIPNNGFEKVL